MPEYQEQHGRQAHGSECGRWQAGIKDGKEKCVYFPAAQAGKKEHKSPELPAFSFISSSSILCSSSFSFSFSPYSPSLSVICYVMCHMSGVFSKHRPSGPMLSISRNVRPSVCLYVRLSVHF